MSLNKVTLSNERNIRQSTSLAKGVVSNHFQLTRQVPQCKIKTESPNWVIMRRHCFINVLSPPFFPSPLTDACILFGIAHSFSPHARSPWRESQKVFHLSHSEERNMKHDSPERPTRNLRTPCPKYLILVLQKIACAYLFAGMKTSLVPQTPRCHWTS